MLRLGTWISNYFKEQLALPDVVKSTATQNAIAILKTHTNARDANSIIQEITRYSASESFAQAIDSKIKPPEKFETEDQFTLRAKKAISAHLLEKFP